LEFPGVERYSLTRTARAKTSQTLASILKSNFQVMILADIRHCRIMHGIQAEISRSGTIDRKLLDGRVKTSAQTGATSTFGRLEVSRYCVLVPQA